MTLLSLGEILLRITYYLNSGFMWQLAIQIYSYFV